MTSVTTEAIPAVHEVAPAEHLAWVDVALGSLAISVPGDHTIPAGVRWFLLAGSVVYAVVIYVFGLLPSAPTLRPAPGPPSRS